MRLFHPFIKPWLCLYLDFKIFEETVGFSCHLNVFAASLFFWSKTAEGRLTAAISWIILCHHVHGTYNFSCPLFGGALQCHLMNYSGSKCDTDSGCRGRGAVQFGRQGVYTIVMSVSCKKSCLKTRCYSQNRWGWGFQYFCQNVTVKEGHQPLSSRCWL